MSLSSFATMTVLADVAASMRRSSLPSMSLMCACVSSISVRAASTLRDTTFTLSWIPSRTRSTLSNLSESSVFMSAMSVRTSMTWVETMSIAARVEVAANESQSWALAFSWPQTVSSKGPVALNAPAAPNADACAPKLIFLTMSATGMTEVNADAMPKTPLHVDCSFSLSAFRL